MAPLSIQTYVVGPVQTNCYFAINDDTKEVLIIDPGASAKQLAEKVKEQGLKPVAILLTPKLFIQFIATLSIIPHIINGSRLAVHESKFFLIFFLRKQHQITRTCRILFSCLMLTLFSGIAAHPVTNRYL